MHKIIKIYWENECFLKLDQSDYKVTLMYPKSCKSDPKVSKSDPRSAPKYSGSLICKLSLAYSWLPWPFKKRLKTNTFLTFSLFGPTKPTHRGQSRNFWKSAPRPGRKHFFANGAKGNLCKKLLFRLLGASGCLFVASGPQSGFAKYLTNMCIICTWAPLMASFGFLMLRSSSIFTLFYFLPLLFPWFFKSVLIYSFVFLKLCSLPR